MRSPPSREGIVRSASPLLPARLPPALPTHKSSRDRKVVFSFWGSLPCSSWSYVRSCSHKCSVFIKNRGDRHPDERSSRDLPLAEIDDLGGTGSIATVYCR